MRAVILTGIVCTLVAGIAWADERESEDESGSADKTPEQLQAEVREILSRDPEEADYTESTRCIPAKRIRSSEVLDEKHIAFRMNRNQYYLVQMEHRCPGLRRGQTVMYEARSAQFCKHDSIRPMERWGMGLQPGARCAIPGFKSVTKEQIVALKEILKAERSNKQG